MVSSKINVQPDIEKEEKEPENFNDGSKIPTGESKHDKSNKKIENKQLIGFFELVKELHYLNYK